MDKIFEDPSHTTLLKFFYSGKAALSSLNVLQEYARRQIHRQRGNVQSSDRDKTYENFFQAKYKNVFSKYAGNQHVAMASSFHDNVRKFAALVTALVLPLYCALLAKTGASLNTPCFDTVPMYRHTVLVEPSPISACNSKGHLRLLPSMRRHPMKRRTSSSPMSRHRRRGASSSVCVSGVNVLRCISCA